jgi:hypothetical protein
MELSRISLEEVLTREEIARFDEQWKAFKGKDEPATPADVHMSFPVISKALRFEDKLVFRTRVLQSERRLRKVNPYMNADRYLMPFWHPFHYILSGEQFYHACMELARPNNGIYFVKEIPNLDLRRPIFWPSHTNGHVSMTGIVKILKGSWESGKAREQFSAELADDKEGRKHGGGYGICFVNFRSFYETMQDVKAGKPESKEKLVRQIEEQDAMLKKLYFPRTTLMAKKQELIDDINQGVVPEERIIDFFNFYDRNAEVKNARSFSLSVSGAGSRIDA